MRRRYRLALLMLAVLLPGGMLLLSLALMSHARAADAFSFRSTAKNG